MKNLCITKVPFSFHQLAERLGSVAPNWSFFLNFMINVTFLGSIFTLMRVPNYIRERWRLRKGETEEDMFRAAKKAARFRWGYHYSLCLLIFSMGVFLSTFIPLILPAALIFFIVRSPVDKYNLLAVRSHARR
jgi:large-conductance mechanosensitive channel